MEVSGHAGRMLPLLRERNAPPTLSPSRAGGNQARLTFMELGS
jgi:hypothetical protein